ncbi:MAG: hypothetical protein HYW70_01420 [Candidatus Nealsonbacteria bacterium]|nr:hypothetical protein [Candidatus Nealsonbacteria bacterium]
MSILFELNGRKLRIDKCMKNFIKILNESGIKTLACCCGHGKHKETIVIKEDGKIIEYHTKIEIPRKGRFYKKDSEGYYYIPEVEK